MIIDTSTQLNTPSDTSDILLNVYGSNYLSVSNVFINSNVFSNVLIPYISSNIIVNILTPYDTITNRNFSLTNYLLRSTATTTYATITKLNLKENILTLNSPLTRTTNTIGIDLSSFSTTTSMNSAISTALSFYTSTTTLNNYKSNYIF